MKTNTFQISCPKCNHEFSPEAAIEAHLRGQLEKEFALKNAESLRVAEEQTKATMQKAFQDKIDHLEKDSLSKAEKLRELENRSLSMSLKEKEIAEREARLQLEGLIIANGNEFLLPKR